MDYEHKKSGATALIEAIETLSSITALEVDSPIVILEQHEQMLHDIPVRFRNVHWLNQSNAEKVTEVVRGIFKVILDYFKDVYKKEYGRAIKPETLKDIRSIMSLVHTAAKKLDTITQVYKEHITTSIKDMKEYRDLSSYYKMKIEPIIVKDANLKKADLSPIQAIIRKTSGVALGKISSHAFLDLNSVKKDVDYELFFIQKEDGTRFFHPDLIKHIMLICHFEKVVTELAYKDAYVSLKQWEDYLVSHIAQSILHECWNKIDLFFKDVKIEKDDEKVNFLAEGLYALMLASHEIRGKVHVVKRSSEYFSDFLKFLRSCVTSEKYVKGTKQHKLSNLDEKCYDLVGSICKVLFGEVHMPDYFHLFVEELLNQEKEAVVNEKGDLNANDSKLYNRLTHNYDALLKSSQKYGNLPLVKILESLEDTEIKGYDPQLMHNFPSFVFYLNIKNRVVPVLRIPTPTFQTSINKVEVKEEFKAFLRQKKSKDRYLILNFQDRILWKEASRARAIEDLAKDPLFKDNVFVVSLTKESDFYNQIGSYSDLNHSDAFIKELLKNVENENLAYHFPEKIRNVLFPDFAKDLANQIYSIFFFNQNVLSRASRMEFIDLFYLFLNMKIIEVLEPSLIGFTCKDALDISFPSLSELFLSLKLLHGKPLTHKEEMYIQGLLLGLPLIVRGRNLFADRFNRFRNLIKIIETTIDERGMREFRMMMRKKIEPLFKGDILNAFGSLKFIDQS